MWDDMLREVLEVGSAISLLRSASENYQDYIPSKFYIIDFKRATDLSI